MAVDGRSSLLGFAFLLSLGTAHPGRAALHALRALARRLRGGGAGDTNR
jgi:hypothetical protein